MLAFSDWFPLATVGLIFRTLGSIKLWGLNRALSAVLASRWSNGFVRRDPPGVPQSAADATVPQWNTLPTCVP